MGTAADALSAYGRGRGNGSPQPSERATASFWGHGSVELDPHARVVHAEEGASGQPSPRRACGARCVKDMTVVAPACRIAVGRRGGGAEDATVWAFRREREEARMVLPGRMDRYEDVVRPGEQVSQAD